MKVLYFGHNGDALRADRTATGSIANDPTFGGNVVVVAAVEAARWSLIRKDSGQKWRRFCSVPVTHRKNTAILKSENALSFDESRMIDFNME